MKGNDVTPQRASARSLPQPRPDIRVISSKHPEWPRLLGESPRMSATELFVQGRKLDPAAACVSVVGTRYPTLAGIEVARELVTMVAQGGYTIVSGLAVGIDAVAHRAALDAGGHTIAVVGAGLDVDYPQRNRALRLAIEAAGTVVSRHPEGTAPAPFHFPERNHVIAALSVATVVVEGGIKSGALITARSALDANRAVFAVPGSIRNAMAAGPNELIKRGEAAPITCAQDLFDALAPQSAWQAPLDLAHPQPPAPSDEEAAVLALLDDVGVFPAALAASGRSAGRIGVVLAHLEVRDLAARDAAGYRITAAGARARQRFLANETG